MAITQAVAASFKKELLDGVHDLDSGGGVFKLALYDSQATINAATTSYTSDREVAASGDYVAAGGVLAGQATALTATTAYVTFTDRSWTGVTITARGALLYNSTAAKKAVCVLDFGADKTATSGTFTVQFPAATSTTAILRIA
jgi:hypothetical protein|tara:strand:+ start:2016 stop:2444 length:429 start_codon:yes stop_codon:yes gene_type:complete